MLHTARVLRFRSAHRLPSFFAVHIHTSPTLRAMATTESLNQEIAQQNTLCNDLRQQNAEASLVEEAKKKLGELKKSLGALNKAAAGGKETKKKERLLLKTAKVRSCVRSASSSGCSFGHSFREQGTMVPVRCSAGNTSNVL